MWSVLKQEAGIDARTITEKVIGIICRTPAHDRGAGIMKERLDVLLVKRGLAESREKAKAIIMSGNVFVNGQREDKAGLHV